MKAQIQSFGRFLSSMVMPNIGAFIAWGLITALFIPSGWLPNEQLAKMVGPFLTYALPLLIAFQGGKIVGGLRGARHGRHRNGRRHHRYDIHHVLRSHGHGSAGRPCHQKI